MSVCLDEVTGQLVIKDMVFENMQELMALLEELGVFADVA